jgi:8-oxo-dGTP pyrophosphatase MutT (NUDIX family)
LTNTYNSLISIFFSFDAMASAADHAPDPNYKGRPTEPKPSSSVVLVSPLNQILLLQRVIADRDHFSGGHVFPGGNVEASQDGVVPGPGKPGRHEDSIVYRLAACRETFEESGILLARNKNGSGILQISEAEREEARHKIHNNLLDFVTWVESLGGICDIEGLRPYTRWITPTSVARRFSTQMYVYMLPLGESSLADQGDYFIPRTDGGKEHNSASFKYAEEWTRLAENNEIVLFPPQYYLITLLTPFIRKPAKSLSFNELQKQRNQLVRFLEVLPADGVDQVPWAKKVISPKVDLISRDERAILLLDDSGPELNHVQQGDTSRFMLMPIAKHLKMQNMEVKDRRELKDYLNKEKAESGKL